MEIKPSSAMEVILKNIRKNQEILDKGFGPRIVGLISGSEEHRRYLQNQFEKTNIFSGAEIFSICEETKKGTFLGSLNFYDKLKNSGCDYKDELVLCGMVFGKGERLYPVTNTLKNIKPSLPTARSIITEKGIEQESMIESVLRLFALVNHYLKQRGFKGVLNKWGDEIQVAGVDLFLDNESFEDVDIVRLTSEMIVTRDLSMNKEWIGYDSNNNFIRQIPRGPIEKFDELYKKGIVKKNENGEYVSGVNLGPVALSYRFLDIALEIFTPEIQKKECYFDFDPYFFTALGYSLETNGRELWEEGRNAQVNELDKMMVANKHGNDFYEKVKTIKAKFEEKYNKKLKIKVIHFGNLYWADIGQHKKMRKSFMNLLEESEEGYIAREISNISHEKDEEGNRIINSELGNVDVKNSIIINSKILNGTIINSVIIDGVYQEVDFNDAFSIGDRVISIKAEEGGGSIKTISREPIIIKEKTRCVSVPLKEGIFCFRVHEDDDLRCTENLEKTIMDNSISFRELFRTVESMSFEEHEKIRKEAQEEIEKLILTKEKSPTFK